jgi:hypothetical protein
MTDDVNGVRGTFVVEGGDNAAKNENEIDVALVDEHGRAYDGLYLRVDITSVPVEMRERASIGKPWTIPDEVMRRLWAEIQPEKSGSKPN